MEEIEIIKPDDWHVHFRDNEILKAVVPETTRHFARSIVMPNLIPPILNAKQAIEYKKRIEKAIPLKDNFEPLMTIYLTEETNKNDLKSAYQNGAVFAVKLYPAGATTNSESGVKDIKKIKFSEHHYSHAASAFYPSPFEEAAILTVDGVGEWATVSICHGKGEEIKILKELKFPHSLGLLYSAITYYTGFKVNSGEYKVMGPAP